MKLDYRVNTETNKPPIPLDHYRLRFIRCTYPGKEFARRC